jgi:hypothetical protein
VTGDNLRRLRADNDRLRAIVAELVPYLEAEVTHALALGAPPEDHDDACGDCDWYRWGVEMRRRLDDGEFQP